MIIIAANEEDWVESIPDEIEQELITTFGEDCCFIGEYSSTDDGGSIFKDDLPIEVDISLYPVAVNSDGYGSFTYFLEDEYMPTEYTVMIHGERHEDEPRLILKKKALLRKKYGSKFINEILYEIS